MVYDLGGGTFDVTLLKLASGNVQTLATDGDVQLGGHDWDRRLVDYAAEAFRKQHQLDPRQDPAGLNRLFQTVMEAKHALSAGRALRSAWNMRAGRPNVPIAREQFEEMTADLLERTAYTSRQLLSAAGLQWKEVNRILLVGGSTRMPMVARMLKELTAIEPDRMVNPDEAVARGAALYAGHLLAERSRGQGGRRLRGHQRQRPQPGHRGHRTRHPPQDQRHFDPPQHPLARQTHGTLHHQVGRATIDRRQGAGGRKLDARRVYGHRPHRGPRSARRTAQGLAGRNQLRVCDQRAAERAGVGAGAPIIRPSWNWSATWVFPAPGSPAGPCRFRRPPASTSSSRPRHETLAAPRSAVAAGSSGILAGSPQPGASLALPPTGSAAGAMPSLPPLGPLGSATFSTPSPAPAMPAPTEPADDDVPPGGGNLSEIPAPLAFRRPRRPAR